MIVLGSSALLGFLAFFEPCTIATHSLFSARNRQQDLGRCCSNLLSVWLARGLLLSLLFGLAVLLLGAPRWSAATESLALAAIALVYLLSRFVYLPVPHLEAARLLPGGEGLPYAIRLGLTLPACTLPLVLITAYLVVQQQSLTLALAAAWLFASLFSLPMMLASFTGMSETGREFLSRSAGITPWMTALLLFSVALWPWLQQAGLFLDSLEEQLQSASLAGLGLALLAGFLFSFKPGFLRRHPGHAGLCDPRRPAETGRADGRGLHCRPVAHPCTARRGRGPGR